MLIQSPAAVLFTLGGGLIGTFHVWDAWFHTFGQSSCGDSMFGETWLGESRTHKHDLLGVFSTWEFYTWFGHRNRG